MCLSAWVLLGEEEQLQKAWFFVFSRQRLLPNRSRSRPRAAGEQQVQNATEAGARFCQKRVRCSRSHTTLFLFLLRLALLRVSDVCIWGLDGVDRSRGQVRPDSPCFQMMQHVLTSGAVRLQGSRCWRPGQWEEEPRDVGLELVRRTGVGKRQTEGHTREGWGESS